MGYEINHITGKLDKVGSGGSSSSEELQSMGEPTGFDLNHSDLIGDISFADSTRTFTIEPKSGQDYFSFWESAKEYKKTAADDLILADIEGIHFIYYDEGVLSEAVNPAGGSVDGIIRLKPLVCVIYWDKDNQEAIYMGEERHGIQMDGVTHSYLHYVNGLVLLNGLGLNSIEADENGSQNAHAQFGNGLGAVSDEDIYNFISPVASTTGYPLYYMEGADGNWRRDAANGFAIRTYDKTTATRLCYNEWTGSIWKLTEESTRDYVLTHIFATTDINNPMIAVMGQNGYPNKRSARAGAETEIHSLVLDNLLFPEIRPIATIIYQTNISYGNDVNARIATTDEGDDYIDWRSETISRISLSSSDHGSLSGLADDDHPQYLLRDNAEYMMPIWAEENSTLGNSAYEWAFGNGANTPSDGGITIYVPSGWTCSIVAMSLRLGSGTATVEALVNGTLQGALCNVTVSAGQSATNSSFTPVAIANNDYVNFRTTSAASTSSPCVAAMYLRYVKT